MPLLDEPLASLDPLVRESLQGLLRTIVSETGMTGPRCSRMIGWCRGNAGADVLPSPQSGGRPVRRHLDEPNAVPGVVEDRTFQGEYWDTCARSARGSLRARSAAAPAIGAACTVALPARHLFVLEAPAATANGRGPSV